MKKAFTLLELVFVIVVIGILASVIIPRINTDRLGEAALQVVSHIRYTQHLAMSEDIYDKVDVDWYKERWQFIFGSHENTSGKDTNGKYAYTIFSDKFSTSAGKPSFTDMSHTEIAVDPLNKNKVLSGGYSGVIDWENQHANINLNLGETYGITNMELSGSCSNNRISFDHLGRPMQGNPSGFSSAYVEDKLVNFDFINQACLLILTSPEGSVFIKIFPETGYTCILDANGDCINN